MKLRLFTKGERADSVDKNVVATQVVSAIITFITYAEIVANSAVNGGAYVLVQ